MQDPSWPIRNANSVPASERSATLGTCPACASRLPKWRRGESGGGAPAAYLPCEGARRPLKSSQRGSATTPTTSGSVSATSCSTKRNGRSTTSSRPGPAEPLTASRRASPSRLGSIGAAGREPEEAWGVRPPWHATREAGGRLWLLRRRCGATAPQDPGVRHIERPASGRRSTCPGAGRRARGRRDASWANVLLTELGTSPAFRTCEGARAPTLDPCPAPVRPRRHARGVRPHRPGSSTASPSPPPPPSPPSSSTTPSPRPRRLDGARAFSPHRRGLVLMSRLRERVSPAAGALSALPRRRARALLASHGASPPVLRGPEPRHMASDAPRITLGAPHGVASPVEADTGGDGRSARFLAGLLLGQDHDGQQM